MRPHWYVLNEDHTTSPMEEPIDYTRLEWDITKRRVLETTVGDAWVSTVFLQSDHAFRDGPPILFETLVFGGDHADHMQRYSTWDEAVAGHAEVVKLVRGTWKGRLWKCLKDAPATLATRLARFAPAWWTRKRPTTSPTAGSLD